MHLQIRNLAELKRAIGPSVEITVIDHWQPQLVGTKRTPKVTRNGGKSGIQGNGYYFDGPALDGAIKEMWAETPKAVDLRFNPDGTVTYYPDAIITGKPHCWTLRFDAKDSL